ncbi:hypothetical protein [Methylotuvimicrobium sp. KM1]|uniref:hypothetical protein n=1 Tax=Methylotuvimicrobium sp. KM1 TaxID=3377707 RepID=UPI0038505D6E
MAHLESDSIDRKARDKLAELVRWLISGQISNFKFEKETPNTDDPGVLAIIHSLWCFYDDFKEHKLSGDKTLPETTKNELKRWIVFLYSDEKYLWPEISYPGVRPIEQNFVSKLFNGSEKEKKFMEAGDYSLWPFFDKEMYDRAMRNPKLLASKK